MLKKCCLALIILSMRGIFMNAKPFTSILQSSSELITSENFLLSHRINNAFTCSGKLESQNQYLEKEAPSSHTQEQRQTKKL